MDTALIVIILLVVAYGLVRGLINRKAADVDPAEVKKQLNNGSGVIIDVRTPEEHAGGHLKEARLNLDVMSGEFMEQLGRLDKNKTYYLYCRSGRRSGKAASIMKRNGFEKVHNIGGYRQLVSAGFEST